MDPLILLDSIATKERELDALRRELARYRRSSALPSGPVAVMRCQLAGRSIAFFQRDVDEVVPMCELTSLPGAPAWCMGLLQLGKARLVVIDLAALESKAPREPDPGELIVIAHSSQGQLGFVVDSIDELTSIEGADVHIPLMDVPFASHVFGVVSVEGVSTLIVAVEPLTMAQLDLEVPR
jgi:chemotaxis signal transduction protein